ncbi:MAG: fatty acid CoA ligase family protein [Candidatus Sumerlaeales bacterium]|nr:fatty acid CoA ligase family protein [Candidatus Sumerlaeales bacterium]
MNTEHRNNQPKLARNIACRLTDIARLMPHKRAIVQAISRDNHGMWSYQQVTFQQLERLTDFIARGLEDIGIAAKVKTIVMIPPSIEFFAITYALLKVGAIPVFIDPGMKRSALLQCISEIEAEAFISIPLGHVYRLLHRRKLSTIKYFVNIGRRLPMTSSWLHNLEDLCLGTWQPYPPYEPTVEDISAILFTSGSTGIPKGTIYTNEMFDGQIVALEKVFKYDKDEIDIPTFPLFALFDTALGMTAVIPKMDFTKPGHVYPPNVLKLIEDQGATHLFGSPALLDRVSKWCIANQITLPTIKRIVTAGAPVRPDIIKNMKSILSQDADIYTAYGATESLPVAIESATSILQGKATKYYQGWGTCVGRPVSTIDAKIARLTDEAYDSIETTPMCDTNEIGEIIVHGKVTTQSYYRKDNETRLSKIYDAQNQWYWHRMGDCGYFDAEGNLWFCGRKSQRVRTQEGDIFTENVEGIFNDHPQVFRSALVGIRMENTEIPVIWIEPKKTLTPEEEAKLKNELLAFSAQSPITQVVKDVLFSKGFPVDIRHNAKIYREELRHNAEVLYSKRSRSK